MTNKKKTAVSIIRSLEQEYPDAKCSLDYEHPHELLIATRLSAQCTDARVNIVTKDLFAAFPTLEAFAQARQEDVERLIRSCGLFKTKARDIVKMARVLVEEHNGVLPDTVEELTKLPGVGRKTANLIVGDIFHKPAVVCDTHCIRITNLLGLTDSTNPLVVEKQLRAVLPPADSNDFCHRMVLHGRATCVARRPQCESCCIAEFCDYFKKLHQPAKERKKQQKKET